MSSNFYKLKNLFGLAGLVVACVFAPPLAAETQYVTDVLQLGVHDTADLSNPAFRNLTSGARVEVVSRNGRYAQIRTADGAIGWVKSLYLVDEEPARTRLADFERENEVLASNVERLTAQVSSQKEQLQSLEQVQSAAVAESTENLNELGRLRSENEELLQKLNRAGLSVDLIWVIALVGMSVFGGFIVGWWWIDQRSRSRHGGYRIY